METYKSGLQADLASLAPCSMQLTAVVPAKDGKKTYKDVLTKYTSKIQRPGFRAGHVPVSYVLSQFGKDICEETAQTLLNRALDEVLSEKKVRLAGKISLENDKLPEYTPDQDFSLKATFEVFPEIELPAYQGLKATRKKAAIEDKKVDEAAETFVRMHGNYEKVTRPAEAGDMLRVDFTTDADDALKEVPQAKYLLSGTNSWQILREPESIPGVIDALVGTTLESTKDVEVHFPGDFRVKELAGKTIPYHFTIREIHGFTPPKFDEAFAERTGAHSLDEVKAKLREQMESNAKAAAEVDLMTQLQKAYSALLDFPLPPNLLAENIQEAKDRAKEHLEKQGLKGEEFDKKFQEECEKADKEVPESMRMVLALDEIAQKEKVEVSQQELLNYCAGRAQSMGMDLDAFLGAVQKQEGMLQNMYSTLMRQKSLRVLLDKADITEVEA